MTPDQYTNAFKKTIEDLKDQHSGELMLRTGMTALTLLRKRVQETGTDANNKKYTPYSTKAMLVGCKSFKESVCKELFGSKEKRRALEWRTIGGSGGYSAYLSVSAGSTGMAGGGAGVRLAILEGGYKRWRELMLGAGKGDIVNFSVSNRMWDDINLISKQSDHQNGVAIIGARTDKEKKKLAGNTKRRGDILDLSQSEQDELIKRYNLNALQVFKQNGL